MNINSSFIFTCLIMPDFDFLVIWLKRKSRNHVDNTDLLNHHFIVDNSINTDLIVIIQSFLNYLHFDDK